jgi:MacB-like periplasmic core domain
MQTFVQDLRYGLRQLQKSPGFTATAILSLALGIGATTAVFSVVYAVLLDPYPYANSDRMVHLVAKNKAGEDRWFGLTGPQYQQYRRAESVESAVAEAGWNLTTTGGDLPEDVNAVYFTGNGFNHFGVPALVGRGLIPADAPEGQDPQPASVTTIIDNAYAESRGDVLLVDDFTGSRAPSVNNLGGANSLVNVTAQACSGPGCSNGANLWLHDPVQHAVELAWPKTAGSASAFAEALAPKGAPVNVSAYKFLSFRVAEQNSTRNPANPGLQDFSVWLKDAKGGVAKVKVSGFKQIHFPVGSGDRKSILATARIPLTDFAPVDLTHVVEIRYLFDQTSKGAIYLSDIRFSP